MKKTEQNQLALAQPKDAAKIFLRPMDKLPFPVVVEAMTGHELIPCIEEDDKAMLDSFAKACMKTIADSEKEPIIANLPNDVSDYSTQFERVWSGREKATPQR